MAGLHRIEFREERQCSNGVADQSGAEEKASMLTWVNGTTRKQC